MSDVSDVESTKPAAEKKPEREGLPAGYRMRADAHYVDQLTSRRADRVYTDQPRPAAPAVREGENADVEARERRDPRERRGDRALGQVAEEIATIESALAMLGAPSSAMAQRVSLDLVKSHAARAGWLLRAHALVDGHRGHIKSRQLGALLGQVRDGLAAECRLSGIALQVHTPDWGANVLVDEQDFIAGLTGGIIATMGLVAQNDGSSIRLTASASADGLQSVEIAQDVMPVPASSAARFFDLSWVDRPGGWPACIGAAAARALVQRDGGSAAFVPGDRRGSTMRLTFARAD